MAYEFDPRGLYSCLPFGVTIVLLMNDASLETLLVRWSVLSLPGGPPGDDLSLRSDYPRGNAHPAIEVASPLTKTQLFA